MSLDEDGYLWFAGRKKQIIVHDGSNISPQDVEGALLAHPAVAAVGVVGVHDLTHGENVRAYVTLHSNVARPSASELIVFARECVGYKAPEDVIFLDEMPLSPAGKTDRTTLKKMAEAQIQQQSCCVGSPSVVLDARFLGAKIDRRRFHDQVVVA